MNTEEIVLTTTDHAVIQQWAEAYQGKPALLPGNSGPELEKHIAISFPGAQDDGQLINISWPEWFAIFDNRQLAFVYKNNTSAGERKPYYELVTQQQDVDLHLQAPGEANREKHINFLEEERDRNNDS